jgi:hypothetical protein
MDNVVDIDPSQSIQVKYMDEQVDGMPRARGGPREVLGRQL